MITLDDLIERFGESELIQLTDHENYQAIDETVANHAIKDATAEVVAYLNPTGLIQHGVYVGTPPKALILKVCDIARYYLYENGTPDIVEKRYEQAIAWLRLVGKNPAMLTGTAKADDKQGICVMPNVPPDMWRA